MSRRQQAASRRRSLNVKRRQRRYRYQQAARRRPKAKCAGPRKTSGLFQRGLRCLVETEFRPWLHAKQVLSLYMIAYGIVHSDRLGVAAVGTAMARALGTDPKHGIKQVDRCLSNDKLGLEVLFAGLVPVIVGQRQSIEVTLDWTEFDKDDHSTVSIALVTPKKRAMPLVWLTVHKSELKGRQRKYERKVLRMLADALPPNIHVVVLADRGFGDVHFYRYIHRTLKFDFVIRYRSNVYVSHDGWLWPSSDLIPRNGRIRVLRDTDLTAKEAGPYTVVLYKAGGMKDSWCLATSLRDESGRETVNRYARRFQCEEAFRDLKDRRYGYGLRFTCIRDCKRRDRLLVLFTLAYLTQTLMGDTSERLGLDKKLRANTVKERTHSLCRQGRALLGELAGAAYAAVARQYRDAMRTLLKRGLLEALA